MPLTSSQWGICLLGPIVYLALVELGKLFDRRSEGEGEKEESAAPLVTAPQT